MKMGFVAPAPLSACVALFIIARFCGSAAARLCAAAAHIAQTLNIINNFFIHWLLNHLPFI